MAKLKQFLKELHAFNKEIDKAVVKKTKEVAVFAFERACFYSPILTGSYILSHRIGVGIIDPTYTEIKPPEETDIEADTKTGPNIKLKSLKNKIPGLKTKENIADNIALKPLLTQEAKNNELSKLVLIKPYQSVYITNRVPWAFRVEHAGWGKRPPYKVYVRTIEDVKNTIQ